MLIISYGMPKTGSTLLFELTKALLEYAGYEQNLAPREVNGGHPINFSNTLDFISTGKFFISSVYINTRLR